MKKLVVMLCLFTFVLPLFAYEYSDDSYETFIQNKLDVFLYYEIYDAFYRKYGYQVENRSLTTTTAPAKIEIKSEGATDSDYSYFYNKYKDYISGAKSPDSEFISARRKLEEKNITANFIPERKVTTYYKYIKVNATNKQKINEVDKVWIAKKGKVKPKPYSFEMELNKYKVLTEKDIKFIIEEFKERFSINKIYYYADEGRVCGGSINSLGKDLDHYFDKFYYRCNGNYELFREYAKEIDEKFKNFYPQNLNDENPQSWKGVPYLNDAYTGTKDFDPDVDIILGNFEGVVNSCEYFVCRVGADKVYYNWLGFGNRIVRVGKTKIIRDKKGQIIAIGNKKIVRDEKGNIIKVGEDVVVRNNRNVIMKIGDMKFFRNNNGNVYYIGNPVYTTNSKGEIDTINGENVIRRKNIVMKVGKKEAWLNATFYIDHYKE